MNSKQLVKVIKTLVETEEIKKHEQFLTKTFPKILKGIEYLGRTQTTEVVGQVKQTEVDPLNKPELHLYKKREHVKKQFTKNETD